MVRLTSVAMAALVMSLCSAFASAKNTAPTPPPTPEDLGVVRVWFSPFTPYQGKPFSLTLDPVSSQTADASVVLSGHLQSDDPALSVRTKLAVIDAAGQVREAATIAMEVKAGDTPFQFHLTPATLPPGDYTIRITANHQQGRITAQGTLQMRILSDKQLEAMLASAETEFAALKTHVDGLTDPVGPYISAKLALSADTLPFARTVFSQGDWPRAKDLASYVDTANKWIQARLSFSLPEAERRAAVPTFDAKALTRHDGFLWQGERPVFLFGVRVPLDALPEDSSRLSRYGLNFAALRPIPGQEGQLSSVLTTTKDQSLAIALDLRALAQPSDTPQSYEAGRETMKQALTFAGRALPHTSDLPFFAAIQVPQMRPSTEKDRARFIEQVKAFYADRNDVNQAWKTHLKDFSEIEFNWNHKKTAYQYELQAFNMNQISDVLARVQQDATSLMPGVAIGVTQDSRVFTKGNAIDGIDYERVSNLMDISACSSRQLDDSRYATTFPLPSALYALLHSCATDKPVIDFEHATKEWDTMSAATAARALPTELWDNVLAGLDGLVLDTGAGAPRLLDWPQLVDSYATAAMDINRLADIVRAFRERPAEIGILWSKSSQIYDAGEPFLQSALAAYEGCAFAGYGVRFVTESQCTPEMLKSLRVLVLPDAQAIPDTVFAVVKEYVTNGGVIVRSGNPLLFDERGGARQDLLPFSANTVLVQGDPTPNKYLHAMDAAFAQGRLPRIPRAISTYGYPVEGVRTHFVEKDGKAYLFIVNLRTEPTQCLLATGPASGRDLIAGRDVQFPLAIAPLDPHLIELSALPASKPAPPAETVAPIPSAVVQPLEAPAKK